MQLLQNWQTDVTKTKTRRGSCQEKEKCSLGSTKRCWSSSHIYFSSRIRALFALMVHMMESCLGSLRFSAREFWVQTISTSESLEIDRTYIETPTVTDCPDWQKGREKCGRKKREEKEERW